MIRKVALLSALVVPLTAVGARGGTPFGGDDTGFVPPNKDVAKCENTIANITTKDVVCLIKCHVKAGAAAFKGKPFDDEPCETACGAVLIKAWNAIVAKNICPPCITQFSPSDVAKGNEQGVDAASGQIACAGTKPLGGDDSGFVAPDKATENCELGVGKNIAKLIAAFNKCDVKAADSAFKGKAFDEEACEDAAEGKYDAANAKLSGCPSCLHAASLGMTVRSADDSGNGNVYCASPSGAFVDGP